MGIIIKIIKVESQFKEVFPNEEGSKALKRFVIKDRRF